ncbi:MAG: hypothetical protein C6I01_06375 [Epsilonproteobacteria bacterium]|nr:hypothetical protein [Campylobacterota bacterium]NPA89500.1 hypothetical protein [Campylobacterota bacterium]
MVLKNFSYFKLTFISENLYPHFFPGVAINRAIKFGLKKLVCLKWDKKCEGCIFQKNCLYFQLERMDFPPIILNFPVTGELIFNILLLGENIKSVSYFFSMLLELEKIGVGKIKPQNVKIKVNDQLLYSHGKIVGKFPTPLQWSPPSSLPPSNEIEVRYLSPVKLPGEERATFLPLAKNIYTFYKKYLLPADTILPPLSLSPPVEIPALFQTSYGIWKKGEKIEKLVGEVGTLKLKNLDILGYQLLKMGEIVGVGEWREIGFGNYITKAIGEK